MRLIKSSWQDSHFQNFLELARGIISLASVTVLFLLERYILNDFLLCCLIGWNQEAADHVILNWVLYLWLCCNPQILNMYHVTDHMRPNQSPHLLSFMFYYITHKFCTSIKYNKTQRKLAGLAWFTLHHHLEMPVSVPHSTI